MSMWINGLDAPVGEGGSGWLAFGLAALSTLQAIALAWLSVGRTRNKEEDQEPAGLVAPVSVVTPLPTESGRLSC